MSARLGSCLVTQAQLESPAFLAWAERLARPPGLNRKTWEFCFIAQALAERGMLAPGRRGLGFAVGREPLVALFAGLGPELTATDVDETRAAVAGFVESGEHARSLEDLRVPGLCAAEVLERNVTFRTVDMNRVPEDLTGFDFVWSACAFEHLGSIERGLAFVERMTRCLKPGGVAVHTTELNISHADETLDHAPTVLFRERDIRELARRVAPLGWSLELDFARGDKDADLTIIRPPYPASPHLKLTCDRFVTTSLGLIFEPRSR